jgi:hypothetical protein
LQEDVPKKVSDPSPYNILLKDDILSVEAEVRPFWDILYPKTSRVNFLPRNFFQTKNVVDYFFSKRVK